jgi:arylsulfatase A-like enzyme/Tfp pilus assembly protein PilF
MTRSMRLTAVSIAAAGLIGAGYWWWSGSRASRHPNLVLITIDTLRADHVGAYGAASGATPSLDAMAAAGVRFDQVQTAVPLTGPSHATILTGQYPPSHGVRGNVVFTLGSKYPTLATRLKREGYATAAFVGAYPVAAAFGFNQGFDTFDEEFHEASVGDPGAERRANEVVDAALRWLEPAGSRSSQGQPFFAWLHFYDPHAPYTPPSPFKERFPGHPYDGEIAFTDAQIGRVFDWLRASGHDADTVVTALADHGEGLGDHNELMHAVLVYQSTMRVPLLMKGPGVPQGAVVSARAGTIDVAPTLMELLGFATDKSFAGRGLTQVLGSRSGRDPVATKSQSGHDRVALYGESLFGRLNCHWATLRSSVVDNWKLILGTEPELYDLARDPAETRNLARDDPARVQSMSIELQRALQRMAPQGDRAQPNAATPEQEQKLRSLGYTSGSAGSGPLDDPTLPDPRTHVVLYDRLQAATSAQGPALTAAFEEVLRITHEDPDNPFAFGTLASMAYRYGSLVVAARAFARALELDPDRPGIRQNYGKLLRELGRFAESERELRIALAQTTDDDSRTRVNLAETLIAMKNTGEADKLLADALAHEPKDPEALTARGRALVAEGRMADAVASLEQAAATTDPDVLIEMAATYVMAGRLDRARAVAGDALRVNPGHPWAMAVMGQALALDGQIGPGLEYLQRAVQIGPRRPAVWDALAAGFDAARRPPEAERCRRQAQALRSAAI